MSQDAREKTFRRAVAGMSTKQKAPIGTTDLRRGIVDTARALGIAPVDLATAISYETAGTFDPTKRGPTTQWGQHRGLIQFGEPQARQFGVDWSNPIGSQLGPNGAVAKYLRSTGVRPGMGMLDVYSAINAGGVGRYNRSDANNGGAPGTVRDKVERQMGGHRRNAQALLGAAMNAQASPAPDFAQAGPSVAAFDTDSFQPNAAGGDPAANGARIGDVMPAGMSNPATALAFADIPARRSPFADVFESVARDFAMRQAADAEQAMMRPRRPIIAPADDPFRIG